MYSNQVPLPVDDVDHASRFYVDWFGATVIPSVPEQARLALEPTTGTAR